MTSQNIVAMAKNRIAILKTNSFLNRIHRISGIIATVLYILGLFTGVTGLISAVTDPDGVVPLELDSTSFHIHTWPSFLVFIIIIWKS